MHISIFITYWFLTYLYGRALTHIMVSDERYVLIKGESDKGEPIRPHNWAERFAGNLADYGPERRLNYSDAVVPVMIDGVKCLLMDRTLKTSDPAMFKDILSFADYWGLGVHGLAQSA